MILFIFDLEFPLFRLEPGRFKCGKGEVIGVHLMLDLVFRFWIVLWLNFFMRHAPFDSLMNKCYYGEFMNEMTRKKELKWCIY